jgi:hypothetical protein
MKTDRFQTQQIPRDRWDEGWWSSDGRLISWDEIEDEHLENIWFMLERRLREIRLDGRLHVEWPKDRAMEAMTRVEAERARRKAAGIIVPRRVRHLDGDDDIGDYL